MALQPYELFGYASNKAEHEEAIAAKIADGWTFHPPVTMASEATDTLLCATFTKDVAPEMTQAMRRTKPRKKRR